MANLLENTDGTSGYHPQKGLAGSAFIRVTTSDVLPTQNTNIIAPGAAGAADNALIYTSVDISGYGYHSIENRSAVAVDVWVTRDGTFNASQPAQQVILTDALTGDTVSVVSIPANKTGYFRGKQNNLKVLQNGAGTINAGEVVIFHGNE